MVVGVGMISPHIGRAGILPHDMATIEALIDQHKQNMRAEDESNKQLAANAAIKAMVKDVSKKYDDVKTILDYNTDVLTCDIHTREKTTKLLKEEGANVFGLHEVLTEPIGDSGCNPDFGLLGSNKATEERLKLFPKTGDTLVREVQKRLIDLTGKQIEVMVYGDGAFKDPVGKIWELADPVVSPAHTDGLVGYPNEIKLKYVSDNKFADLKGDELKEAIKEEIRQKDEDLTGQMITEGTTPRVLTDLIGSLCDLTSGSGDKGTPVIFIQGYFDNLAND